MMTNLSAFCDGCTILAGMPSVRLTGETSVRLQGISFFLMGIVVSTLVVWWAWNWLRRDLTALPKLSLPGAAGLTVLWGMLFIIVLTMISGARELMTPKAWEPDGLTYKLEERWESPPGGLARERENEIKLVSAVLRHHEMAYKQGVPERLELVAHAAEELGMIALADSLETNYWYDESEEKSAPILIRQIYPQGEPAWGITSTGEIVRLDQAEKPERKSLKTDSDDS